MQRLEGKPYVQAYLCIETAMYVACRQGPPVGNNALLWLDGQAASTTTSRLVT
jgi:hypothetical protein